MNKNSFEPKYVRQVVPAAGPDQRGEFELVSRKGEVIPFSVRYQDLAVLACLLGFGPQGDLADHLFGLEQWKGAVLDIDGEPDVGPDDA